MQINQPNPFSENDNSQNLKTQCVTWIQCKHYWVYFVSVQVLCTCGKFTRQKNLTFRENLGIPRGKKFIADDGSQSDLMIAVGVSKYNIELEFNMRILTEDWRHSMFLLIDLHWYFFRCAANRAQFEIKTDIPRNTTNYNDRERYRIFMKMTDNQNKFI